MPDFLQCPCCYVTFPAGDIKPSVVNEAYCLRCGGTEISYVSAQGNPYCANRECSHMMTWGKKPEGFNAPHPN